MSNSELIVSPQQAGTMAVYDRVGPMEFVEKFGKVYWITGAGGAKTKEEGELLALACLCERKTIFEINREFHLMDGKLSMRADAMLAKFRQIGGKHKWAKTGDDGIEAAAEFTFDGQVTLVKYSIEDAKRAGLVKDKGNWVKNPASMLRARVISNAIRMLAPEVVAGYYTPEENEDVAAERNERPAAVPTTDAKAVKSRAKELKEMAANGTPNVAAATNQPAVSEAPAATSMSAAGADGDVIDASFTVVPDAAAETVSETVTSTTPAAGDAAANAAADVMPTRSKDATQPGSSETETLMEIEALLTRAGSSKEKLEAQLKAKNPDFTTLDSLSEVSALTLLRNLEAKVNAKK